MYGYRFYIKDELSTLKPFFNGGDRRLLSIRRCFDCEIALTSEVCLVRAQKMRAVIVQTKDRKQLELCLRRIDETFPKLYACANLQNAGFSLKTLELKKYLTNEDLMVDRCSIPIIYYQLTFYFEPTHMPNYEEWKKSSASHFLKKLGCMLAISQKDVPGGGFLRRCGLINGENRKNVVKAYELFQNTFRNLPQIEEEL